MIASDLPRRHFEPLSGNDHIIDGFVRQPTEKIECMYSSCIIRRIASVGGLDCLFHASDFIFRQGIKVACTFPRRESAIVLQAVPNEEIDLPVGHVHDLLDSPLGLIVVRQEHQLFDEFRIDGLLDEPEGRG